jgi:ATP-dependent 26S proteasome regulatory subunit
MLAQGSKTLFVITTNERIGTFHPAVVRPGRCLSRVSFEPLPPEQAKAWLLERGAGDVAKGVTGSATVAELYAMAAGELDPSARDVRGGVYL